MKVVKCRQRSRFWSISFLQQKITTLGHGEISFFWHMGLTRLDTFTVYQRRQCRLVSSSNPPLPVCCCFDLMFFLSVFFCRSWCYTGPRLCCLSLFFRFYSRFRPHQCVYCHFSCLQPHVWFLTREHTSPKLYNLPQSIVSTVTQTDRFKGRNNKGRSPDTSVDCIYAIGCFVCFVTVTNFSQPP